jgi:hypothetical protein
LNTKATFSSFIYSELVTITLIDNGITHSRRQRREADTFPPILQFNLTSKTKHIELFLRRKSLKAAVPYYTQVYDEIVKHTPANEKVSKYIKIPSTEKKPLFLIE